MSKLKAYLKKQLGLTSDSEDWRVELDDRDEGSICLGRSEPSFYYKVLRASCGVCLLYDFSGDMSKDQWLELLKIFFSRNPDQIELGAFEDELSNFDAGFSHIIFLDTVSRSPLTNLKTLCHASTVETNPNTGNDVILYTYTRTSFQQHWEEYQNRKNNTVSKHTKPKKTYLTNLQRTLRRSIPKTRSGFGYTGHR